MHTYFAIVGACCIALAVWLAARRLRVALFGLVAAGTVVGHEERESDGSVFRMPIVTYRDAAGFEQRFTSVAGRGRARVRSAVTVRYLPSDPRNAYIAGFVPMWAAPVALLVLGAAGLSVLWTGG